MSMFWTFCNAKSLHQINKSSKAAETLYKNDKTSRRYALDSSFLRGTNNCSRYLNDYASQFEIFNQHSKVNIGSYIDFGVSRSFSRFRENDTKSATREGGKDKNPMQRTK